MGFLLYAAVFLCCFYDSLFIFNFSILIVMCLGVGLLGFILFGTFFASWVWISVFVHQVREVFSYYFFKVISFQSSLCPSFTFHCDLLYD